MRISQSDFVQPPKQYGMLKIAHGFAGVRGDRLAGIAKYLDELCALHYAGVVINVSFENGYVENEDNWTEFREVLRMVKTRGMRLWFYDEKGYPSGTAGGITLRDHPEYDARGIVCRTGYGEAVDIPHPEGHYGAVAAIAYDAPDADHVDFERGEDISRFITPEGGLAYRGEARICCLIVEKPAYDMTHAAQNVCELKHYVDVMRKEAIGAFVENTYEAYYRHVPEAFDGWLEAIFTDEPSYMAPYIDNEIPRDPGERASLFGGRSSIPVIDRPNPNMPLYPTAIWTPAMLAEFAARRGYDLTTRLPALFFGECACAQRIRLDFYHTASELYEENFFGQLGAWCAAHGTKFSGHALLEDHIKYHAMYEGNFFANMRHMGMPGIDMLVGRPEPVRKDAFTPKLLSSIAHLNGLPGVMSESSTHFDSAYEYVSSLAEKMGGAAIQYACGVTLIHSYYNEREMTPAEFARFGQFMRRMTMLIEDGVHQADVLLYYPIESLWTHTFPSDESMWSRRYHPRFEQAAEGFMRLADELLKQQADYDMVDSAGLLLMSLSDGKLHNGHGESFSVLVLPWFNVISDALLKKLEACAAAGIRLIFMTGETGAHDIEHGSIPETGWMPPMPKPIAPRGESDDIPARFAALLGASELAADAGEAAVFAAQYARRRLVPLAYQPRIVTLHKSDPDGDLFLFVNTENRPHNLRYHLDVKGSLLLLDPTTGDSAPLPLENGDLSLSVPGYAVKAIVARR